MAGSADKTNDVSSTTEQRRGGGELDHDFTPKGSAPFRWVDPLPPKTSGGPLAIPFDDDLGCGLEYPAFAPTAARPAWRVTTETFVSRAGIIAIALLCLVSIWVRPAHWERRASPAKVAVTSNGKTERGRNASFPPPPTVRLQKATLRGAPVASSLESRPRRYEAVTPFVSAPGQRRYLGVDEEPTISADGRRGMRISRVYPGTAAPRWATRRSVPLPERASETHRRDLSPFTLRPAGAVASTWNVGGVPSRCVGTGKPFSQVNWQPSHS